MRFLEGQALRSTGFHLYEESNKLRLQMVRDYENVVKRRQPFSRGMVSFIGGQEIRKIGVENPEPTAAEEPLTDLKGGSSL